MDLETAVSLYNEFKSAKPFPHIVIDDFLNSDTAENIYSSFPDPTDEWYEYDNCFEKKRAMDKLDKMPQPIAEFMLFANSHIFMDMIERITNISGLIPDPAFRGGGMHAIMPGGFLSNHTDFTIHPKLKVYRRLNVIIFMNKKWDKSWGGNLELWDRDMTKCHKSIEPIFNRAVIFDTHKSPHGHPDPLNCPVNEFRKSLAIYYYSSEPPEENVESKSTCFLKRPGEVTSEETEKLRAKRNFGRLSSNV